MDRMTREEEKEMPKKISKQTPMGRKTQGRSKIKYMEYIEQDIGALKNKELEK